MRDELLPHRSWIVGGNLAQTRDCLIVDVTLLGEANLSRVLTRGGERDGDGTHHIGGWWVDRVWWPPAPGAGWELKSRKPGCRCRDISGRSREKPESRSWPSPCTAGKITNCYSPSLPAYRRQKSGPSPAGPGGRARQSGT